MPLILFETTPQDIVRRLIHNLPATKCINYFMLFYMYIVRMYLIRVHNKHTMTRDRASPKGMHLYQGIPKLHTRIVTRDFCAHANTHTTEY
jgi:hypothetical protein